LEILSLKSEKPGYQFCGYFILVAEPGLFEKFRRPAWIPFMKPDIRAVPAA
jgi:hypothetical protein